MLNIKLLAAAKAPLLERIILSLQEDYGMYIEGIVETLYMTFLSAFFAYILGFALASILFLTGKNGINKKPLLSAILGWIVNMARSLPFLILLIVLIPITKFIIGKSVGTTAMIIPLTVGATPMVARILESSFEEVDHGVIESAVSMGASNLEIIFKVVVPEAVPSIIRGMSLSSISVLGFTALAGSVGGGGLGKIAMTYGYTRNQTEVLVITVVLLIIIVQIIQSIFNLLANSLDKRL